MSKNCAYRDSNSDCLSRVRRSAGLSIPGRDIYNSRAVYLFVHCAHIIALSIPFHYFTGSMTYLSAVNTVLLVKLIVTQ